MTWYKFLSAGATGPFSHFRWPPPQDGEGPGEWVVARGPLDPCRAGLHLCRPADLPLWMMEELYTVEVDGPVLEYDDFLLARRARLLRRVEPWGRDSASSFTSQCVERVRDLTVEALHRERRGQAATRLVERDAMEDLLEEAQRLLDTPAGSPTLVGYLVDAARFSTSARTDRRWPAHAATVAFVAATAARAAAPPGQAEAAVAAERARQAEWLSEHLVASA
jgi:hypothetical protein